MTEKTKSYIGLALLAPAWLAFLLQTWDYGVRAFTLPLAMCGYWLVRSAKFSKIMQWFLYALAAIWFLGAFITQRHTDKPFIVNGYDTGGTYPEFIAIPICLKIIAIVCLIVTAAIVLFNLRSKKA